jgi:CheY-like chemotaxis protein
MMATEPKKVFLIASDSAQQRAAIERMVNVHYPKSTIYFAVDGSEAWSKAGNVPPHVFIVDAEIPKMSGLALVDQVTRNSNLGSTAMILVGTLPTDATHVDEFITGKLQYFNAADGETDFKTCLAKAMNFAFQGKTAEFSLRFLTEGERLITEGDKADTVFILKEGRMRAFRVLQGKETTLGYVEKGEFVGEMAYINGEPRAANVDAVTTCELIEVPVGTLERVLYRRPSWSKTLLRTLAKRVKQANAAKVL